MAIELDARDPNRVKSFRHIVAELSDPTKRLHVMSGIAVPGWIVNDDDHVYREQCIVNLGLTLPDFEQATSQVGLASVGNDETAFLMALDDNWVEPDPRTGELHLFVDMALRGEETSIGRFGFQVVALAGSRATGVSGRVLWSRNIFDASRVETAQVPGVLAVTANTIEQVNMGSGAFAKIVYHPLASATLLELRHEGDDFWVTYAFEHLPLGVPLHLTVGLSTAFPVGVSAGQISGPDPVQLSLTNLYIKGVDFRVSPPNVVR
jgi:hypothetical protein